MKEHVLHMSINMSLTHKTNFYRNKQEQNASESENNEYLSDLLKIGHQAIKTSIMQYKIVWQQQRKLIKMT